MDVYVGGEGKEGEGERGLGAQFFDGRAYLLYREHCTVLPIIRYALRSGIQGPVSSDCLASQPAPGKICE